MRKAPLILVIAVFGVWFLAKGLPFLDTAPAAVSATPIPAPGSAEELAPVNVGRGQRVCVDGISYGPDARYAQVTMLSPGKPAGALRFEARATGYSADADVPAGTVDNAPVTVALRPAEREVAGGSLCIVNRGRAIAFYGIDPSVSPARTTVDGAPQKQQDLSVTLLTSGSQPLGDRLGDLFAHAAAFNPMSTWCVWILFALVLVGAPIAIGVALARAAADDDAPEAP
jgi:hypothetical protein